MASVTPSVTSSPTVAQDLGSSIFLTWLSNSSPEKIHKVLNSIEDEKAKISLMGMLIKSPPKQHVILEQPVAPRAAAMAPVKLKKALNAFVGFRTYYLHIPNFKPWPMKQLSGLMAALWDHDPNKHIWSLMAKAWSIIRDQVGKDNASLREFFDIVCPYLNIPIPENYLQHLRWTYFIDEHQAPAVSRDPYDIPVSSDVGFTNDALSVGDIIEYTLCKGYANGHTVFPDPTNPAMITFTSGPNSRAVPLALAGEDLEKRMAERRRRQAKREIAKQYGFGAAMRKRVQQVQLQLGHIEKIEDPVERFDFNQPINQNATNSSSLYHDLRALALSQSAVGTSAQQDTFASQQEDTFMPQQAFQSPMVNQSAFNQSGIATAGHTQETSEPDTNNLFDFGFREGADEDATLPGMQAFGF